MKKDRRWFLGAGAAAIAGVLAADVCSYRLTNPVNPLDSSVVASETMNNDSHFNVLWNMIKGHNELRNKLYCEGGVKAVRGSGSLGIKWSMIRHYSSLYYPDSGLSGSREEDYYKSQQFFRQHGHVYNKYPDVTHPNIDAITLGDLVDRETLQNIIGTDGKESLSWRGRELNYNIAIFDQVGRTIEDPCGTIQDLFNPKYERVANFEENDNTIYINRTKLKRNADEVFAKGPSLQPSRGFNESMKAELYDLLYEGAKTNNPGFEGMSTEEQMHIFADEFVRVASRSLINHEKWHPFYGETAPTEEVETYLHQVAEDPKFNSYVFTLTGSIQSKFYKAFEDAGYTKEALRKMKPQERSDIAIRILEGS